MIKHVDVSLLNSCNYNCDYCGSGSLQTRCNNPEAKAYDISSPVIDYEALISFTRKHLDGWILQITGGEPLTLPGIEYLLSELAQTNKLVLCTNGSMLPRKPKLLKLPKDKVFFRVSVHPEQRKVSNLFKDVQGVVDSGHGILLNYMVHPRHITSNMYDETAKALQESRIPFELTPFEGIFEGQGYKLFDKIYWYKCEPRLIATEPLQMLTIRPNGLVFKCHGESNKDMDGTDFSNGSIGDVYKGTLDISHACLMNCTMPDKSSLCPVYDPLMRVLDLWS
jgi:organic radical activating enzyme